MAPNDPWFTARVGQAGLCDGRPMGSSDGGHFQDEIVGDTAASGLEAVSLRCCLHLLALENLCLELPHSEAHVRNKVSCQQTRD
jgi:hypothetical protein